jgi:uncharacterized protein YecE (DUF72 family)
MTTRFHIGTSGYSYSAWKGSFYPEKLSSKKMLSYYGEHFDACEMNGTFYKLPSAESVAMWMPQVPSAFQFAVKAPQRITHFQRLKEVDETVAEFLKVASVLKKQLGPLLFQLPPNFKKDLDRLRPCLKLIPKSKRVAFEFRHASWFDQDVYDLLAKRNVALVAAETEDGPKASLVATADWGYLRLRLPEYTDASMKKWIKHIRSRKWSDAFVFFKHEDEGKGPVFAQRFWKLVKKTS